MAKRKRTARSFCRARINCVYLICLQTPLIALSGQRKKVAHHYVGSTINLAMRFRLHRSGEGASFLRECNKRGIVYRVVRTWKAPSKSECRLLEKKIKARRSHKFHCPVCNGLIDFPDFDIT